MESLNHKSSNYYQEIIYSLQIYNPDGWIDRVYRPNQVLESITSDIPKSLKANRCLVLKKESLQEVCDVCTSAKINFSILMLGKRLDLDYYP